MSRLSRTSRLLRSQHLKNETFQVPRFRHGGEDGMIAGLPTLFKQANLPFRIS